MMSGRLCCSDSGTYSFKRENHKNGGQWLSIHGNKLSSCKYSHESGLACSQQLWMILQVAIGWTVSDDLWNGAASIFSGTYLWDLLNSVSSLTCKPSTVHFPTWVLSVWSQVLCQQWTPSHAYKTDVYAMKISAEWKWMEISDYIFTEKYFLFNKSIIYLL